MSDQLRKDLGETLKQAREKEKLTQMEVAKSANIHVNYYARIERGIENPTFERLFRILKALRVNVLDISKFRD
jgi:transcriptional regulator with XRE-family HTH domain